MNRIARGTGVLLTLSSLVWLGCGSDAAETDATEGDMPAATETAGEPAAEPMEAETATAVFLDPNQASVDDLAAVQGMSAEAADALVAGRPYTDMLAVDQALAAHVDSAGRDAVYARVWMPIDLNTAAADEILLIPGVGSNMLREFEEYRPYTNIAQFRREIGKYVDETEVARLERYVVVR